MPLEPSSSKDPQCRPQPTKTLQGLGKFRGKTSRSRKALETTSFKQLTEGELAPCRVHHKA